MMSPSHISRERDVTAGEAASPARAKDVDTFATLSRLRYFARRASSAP
jgi:hypothetical protein